MRARAGAALGQARQTQGAQSRPLPPDLSSPAAWFPVLAPPAPHPKRSWHSPPHPHLTSRGVGPGTPIKTHRAQSVRLPDWFLLWGGCWWGGQHGRGSGNFGGGASLLKSGL